ncbi:DUF6090 family protein [Formosa maritima]|uniref:Uncharacterized protein n=1 Tax=Formosa maritima TaxID=2592046 RepID=A0A5D0GCS0_9FLAO|nr:DUF6090 family protein [Formosa maritima]TYA56695.1 hypothetical protein FVF61_06055 [Formosa maritima]
MIKFFRKIRKNLLSERKTGKYLKYAIGEIIIVVIGILIALQINNWNESRKLDHLIKKYEENIVNELKSDLLRLNVMDSIRNSVQKRAENYLEYYNSDNPDINTLIVKFDSINPIFDLFTTSTFTAQDLVAAGNLKLFSSDKKNAILKFIYDLDRYQVYEQKTLETVLDSYKDFKKEIDILYSFNFAKKEHALVENWRYDLNSNQIRLQHNFLANLLLLFEYQEGIYKGFRKQTNGLTKILE